MRNSNLFWAIPATGAIGAIWVVSACANWYFGASLGYDTEFSFLFFRLTTAQLFSGASLASDVLKMVMLFGVGAGLASRNWQSAGVCGAIWFGCVIWSIISAVGFVSLNGSTVTDNRGKTAAEWTQLEGEVKSFEKQRKAVGEHRPEGVVQAEIDALLLTPGVGGCAVINGPITQGVCPKVGLLKVELGHAKAANWIDGRLNELRQEMKTSKKVTSANPLADMIALLLGINTSNVSIGQALFFAFMLELISGPGMWAVWTAARKTPEGPAKASFPVSASQVAADAVPPPPGSKASPETAIQTPTVAEPAKPVMNMVSLDAYRKPEPVAAPEPVAEPAAPAITRQRRDEDIDAVTREYLAECCQTGGSDWVDAVDAHEDHRQWRAANGYQPLDASWFGRSMGRCVGPKKRKASGATYNVKLLGGAHRAAQSASARLAA